MLRRVFEVSATLIGPSFADPTLRANAFGAADRTVWEDSLSFVGPNRVEVNYLDTLENATTVPVGIPLGLRWTLETAAEFRGPFVRASVISDFHNTATLDFDFAPGEEGSSFVEIFTVPEPGMGALLALGGVVAIVIRRRR